jgi:hypothetical protein
MKTKKINCSTLCVERLPGASGVVLFLKDKNQSYAISFGLKEVQYLIDDLIDQAGCMVEDEVNFDPQNPF